MLKLKKKDIVIVTKGKDRGKKGEIKEVFSKENRVTVVGVNIVSKHRRATKDKPGGIQKVEAPISISNVRLVCPKCNKITRPRFDKMETGEKVRVCRKCNEIII